MRGIVLLFACLCVAALSSALPNGFVHTPLGPLPNECVHRVKSGSHVYVDDEGFATVYHPVTLNAYKLPSCDVRKYLAERKREAGPLEYDGWLAYTTFQTTVGFRSFLGYFSVPDQPAYDPEVLYLFTGLQNVNWIPIVDPEPPVFDIIQPVLQYPGDGGNYWSVKSWYVTLNSGYLVSDEVQVNVGDNIYGNMTQTGAQTWYIGGTSTQNGQTTSITVTHPRLAVQPWAYNTLECYGCSGGCSYEPTVPVQFTKLIIIDANGITTTPKWVPSVSPTRFCNEHAVVNSPTSVTINFH